MITAAIGKIFLDAYNEKHGTNYDAKTFFVEVYHPLFFGSNKYLQWVSNSPFVQGLESSKSGEYCVKDIIKDEKGKTKTFKSKEELDIFVEDNYSERKREIVEIQSSNLKQVKILWKLNTLQAKRMLDAFVSKVNEKSIPDASIAPGYPASEEENFAATSCQVTNINIMTSKDDVYLSWLGASLGIGLQNGISILFTEPEILMDLFDGWKLYRTVLNENDSLKGNQVNSWNGQWLAHRYDKGNFYPEQPMAGFSPFETTKDGMSVTIQSWTKVLIGIALHYDRPKMMGYVYSLGKTNTTIGFIPFNLEHIRKPIQLYAKLFGTEEGKSAERLWGTEMGFRVCCQKGAIGIEAMQPKGLRQYMDGTKMPKKAQDENQKITFNTYLIWILSMLNNQDLWSKSMGFAKALLDYSKSGKSSKTVNSQKVNNILAATSKKSFISALTEIVGDSEEREQIVELAEFVNSMPTDNVPYFLTLLRFCFVSNS